MFVATVETLHKTYNSLMDDISHEGNSSLKLLSLEVKKAIICGYQS